MKAQPASTEVITATAEAPSGKAKIEFEKKGDLLVSKTKLPEGEGYQVVLQAKSTPEAKTKNFRIKLQLHICKELRQPRIRLHLRRVTVLVMVDIIRRFVGGSEPVSSLMLIISCVALAANLFCLYLISKERTGEVHMRASWIFSKNDVLANLGVIIAGALIYFTGSRWPDLIIGSIITIVVLRGGFQILKEAKADKEAQKAG
jgi:hypothetical protein